MKQGAIWYADLNPTIGREQAGFRPVVIVSGNLMAEHHNVVFIVPLITKIKNYKGNPILTPNKTNGLKARSEMVVSLLRSVPKDRLIRKLGCVAKDELDQVLKTVGDLLKY